MESINVIVRVRPEPDIPTSTKNLNASTPTKASHFNISSSGAATVPYTEGLFGGLGRTGSCIECGEFSDDFSLTITGSTSRSGGRTPHKPTDDPPQSYSHLLETATTSRGFNTPTKNLQKQLTASKITTPTIGEQQQTHEFQFDRVHGPRSTQQSIFESVEPLVVDACMGFHTTVFAYGCTGSGKTYTIMGDNDGKDSKECEGIVPRAVDRLFLELSSRPNSTSMVFITYVELYNNVFYDLLASPDQPQQKIEVRESISSDSGRGVFLSSVHRQSVTTPSEVKKLVQEGSDRRATRGTDVNERSSRSHAILTIEIESLEEEDQYLNNNNNVANKIKMGKIHLVDLAGSERVQMSGVEGDALAETGAINASLSALGDVLNALSKHHKQLRKHGGDSSTHSTTSNSAAKFIPFRNSKLTHLLKDSLGGSCKTCMIATVRQSSVFYSQSLSTLRYASRARDIQNKPKIHGTSTNYVGKTNKGEESRLAQAYSEIRSLRAQLQKRASDFETAKRSEGGMRSPELKQKLSHMHKRHSQEIKALEKRLGGIVQNTNNELIDAKADAQSMEREMEKWKRVSDIRGEEVELAKNKLRAQEAQSKRDLEAARFKLDKDSKKVLKKLADDRKVLKEERKVLQEKNVSLENEVIRLRKEQQNENKNQVQINLVDDLQAELQTLRSGLENAVKAEDLALENKQWRVRVGELQELVTTLKEQADKCKEDRAFANDKLARQISMNKNLQDDVSLAQQSIESLKEANHVLQVQSQSLKEKLNESVHQNNADIHTNANLLNRKEAECNALAATIESLKHSEAQLEKKYNSVRKRLDESQKVAVEQHNTLISEKCALEGRYEHTERELNRLKQDYSEERRKREFTDRDNARLEPLNMKVGKLAEENSLLSNDNEEMRNKILKLEGETRATTKMTMERDELRKSAQEATALIGQQRAELEQLRGANSGANTEIDELKNSLQVEKNLNLDLRVSFDRLKSVQSEVEKRKDELLTDLKKARAETDVARREKEEIYEDKEALSAMCNSLKRTVDQLENRLDSMNSIGDSKLRESEDERQRLEEKLEKVGEAHEGLKRKMLKTVSERDELTRTNFDLKGKVNNQASVIESNREQLMGIEGMLAAESERRSAAEERLATEMRSSQRLLEEVENDRERVKLLKEEIELLRGRRDGDNAAHVAERDNLKQAANRERSGREAAEFRMTETERKLNLIQATLTQECGTRKGVEASRDAAVIERDAAISKYNELKTLTEEMKEEIYSMTKQFGDVKDENHKIRASALAMTMEVDNVRKKMGLENEALTKEIEKEKNERVRLEAERNQIFLDSDEMRTVLSAKSRELDASLAQSNELEHKLSTAREEAREASRKMLDNMEMTLKTNEESRKIGFKEGMEAKGMEVMETAKKMQEEMAHCIVEMRDMAEAKELADKELSVQHEEFEKELDHMHAKLDARGEEIVELKRAVARKEEELIKMEHALSVANEDLRAFKSKTEFEAARREEDNHQITDVVHSLRKRTQSLEKELAKEEETKKALLKGQRKSLKNAQKDLKAAVSIVRTHVGAGEKDDAEMRSVLTARFNLDDSDASSTFSPVSSYQGTPGENRRASTPMSVGSSVGSDFSSADRTKKKKKRRSLAEFSVGTSDGEDSD